MNATQTLKYDNILFKILIMGIFIGLWSYIIYRAWLLPMTHDEPATCLFFAQQTILDIISYKDPIPNNHILNTLFIKFSTSIFGMSKMACRLPNILSFVLYFFFAWAFVRKVNIHPIIQLLGVCSLCFNPFLLDFFSLARGYGLSLAFLMGALYHALSFLKGKEVKNLIATLFLGVLSVYSNFTALIAFLGIATVLGIFVLQEKEQVFKRLGIIASFIVVLFLMIIIPIKKMVASNQLIYWGMAGFYKETMKTLMADSLNGASYFDTDTVEVFIGISVIFLLIYLFSAFYDLKNNNWKLKASPLAFFVLLLGMTFLINYAQVILTNTPFLTRRTALSYYPLTMACTILLADYLYRKEKTSVWAFALPLVLFTFIHIGRTYSFDCFREWYFDGETYKVLAILKEEYNKSDKSKKISLNASWIFQPSFSFHTKIENSDWINEPPYHKEVQPDAPYDYYFATADDAPQLEKNYEKIASFWFNSKFLMKRRQ